MYTARTPCALDGCGKPIGTAPYGIAGRPDVFYCSRACMDAAFYALQHPSKKPKKESVMPHVKAEDFGPNSGVIRRFCDGCGEPITLCWKGRDGKEYCSNACKQAAAEAASTSTPITGENEMETEVMEEAVSTPPIVAGNPTTSSKKKKSKAAATEAKPSKTAKKKAAALAQKASAASKTASSKKTAAAAKKGAKTSKKAEATNGNWVPRPGTKAELVLGMIQSENGASLKSLMKKTEWQQVAVLSQIYDMKRKLGYSLTIDGDGENRIFKASK